MMGFKKVPLPRSALRCPSLPRAQRIGAIGGPWDTVKGCDAAPIASLLEAAALVVAPSNNDFKVWRREYFIDAAGVLLCRWGYPAMARDYICLGPNLKRRAKLLPSVQEIAAESSSNCSLTRLGGI
jgi:hypothetical protein